jgi:hypothetical protein
MQRRPVISQSHVHSSLTGWLARLGRYVYCRFHGISNMTYSSSSLFCDFLDVCTGDFDDQADSANLAGPVGPVEEGQRTRCSRLFSYAVFSISFENLLALGALFE